MLPKTRGVRMFVVPMFGKLFLEEFAGKNAGLQEAVHAFADFNIHLSIMSFFE
jgi:hypothetical protein